ncbi:MAG: chromosome segregation ATPase [Chloroflexi bacterium]|nr:chromosome segregation ATPase [Chloroflexota bacterium]
MATIIAFAQRKGGSGKTTSAFNIAGALGQLGQRVLLIDMDPQVTLSTLCSAPLDCDLPALLRDGKPLDRLVCATPFHNVSIIPGRSDMVGLQEQSLPHADLLLKRSMDASPRLLDEYDMCLIDSPPLLGRLTLNVLVAAHTAILPLNPQDLGSRQALDETLGTIERVRNQRNYTLQLGGILMGQVRPRTSLGRQAVAAMRARFGKAVYEPIIPDAIGVQESLNARRPMVLYRPRSASAQAYRQIAAILAGV